MKPRAAALAMAFLGATLPTGQARPADAPLPDLPDYVFAVLPEEEDVDILYFGESGPTPIRFRIRIGGRGFRSAWDAALGRLYRFADANNDGTLTEAEAARPGWVQLIANPNGGIGSAPVPAQGDGKTTLRPVGGKVSLEAFRRYVREGLGHGPMLNSAIQAADPTHQSAFNQIDADRDGSLTPDELASAPDLIRRLDSDEDEVVDKAELDPSRNPFEGVFFEGSNPLTGDPFGGPFVPLATAEARSRAARRYLARSDGADASTRDERLSPAEAGLAPEGFRRADADSDGRLDLAEIERFLADPSPSIVLVVRIPGKQGEAPAVRLPTPAEDASSPDPRVRTKPDRGLTLALDGREVRLSSNDSIQDFSRFFERRFQAADLDKDGAVDREESRKDGFFSNLFDAADRDVDGKVTKAELSTYLERTLDLARSRASIAIKDTGRAFFDILDADDDGRLGRRELRDASRHLKASDRDGDGRVRLEEIPVSSQIAVGRGPAPSDQRGFNFEAYDSTPPPRPGAKGPEVAWFRRMDRNRDGDVSPAEFLGPPQDFRKLDADGDGLIDPGEAAKGH